MSDDLRKLAEAASQPECTGGEWHEFRMAFPPTRILSLLDENQRLREALSEEIQRLRCWLRDFGHLKQPSFVSDLTAVLDATESWQAEREALRELYYSTRWWQSVVESE